MSSSEETKFYDDIRCLAADWRAHRGDDRAFVRIGGSHWIEAQAASYAQPDGIQTAMASGLAAFGTAAEARAADREGRALTFDEIMALSGGAR